MSQTSPTHKPHCGPHVDIAKNDGARIARCPCGTVHVHMLRSGVSVQLDAAAFAEIAEAIGIAREVLDVNVRARPHSAADADDDANANATSSPLPRGRGEFVTVQITPSTAGKKPTMN